MILSKLDKFYVWLQENKGGRLNCIYPEEIKAISKEFLEATAGGNYKYCRCKNKGKCVNQIWNDWHCTYCLKPTKEIIWKKSKK